MKLLVMPLLAAGMFLATGCTTKVYNQTPPVGQNTVIEHDRPTVIERPMATERQPEVQNNIHVDPR